MMQEFGVDERVLYRTWVVFLDRLARREKASETIKFLRLMDVPDPAHSQSHARALDYFLLLGLNRFSDFAIQEMGGQSGTHTHQ